VLESLSFEEASCSLDELGLLSELQEDDEAEESEGDDERWESLSLACWLDRSEEEEEDESFGREIELDSVDSSSDVSSDIEGYSSVSSWRWMCLHTKTFG
jgi:hypothetical protein